MLGLVSVESVQSFTIPSPRSIDNVNALDLTPHPFGKLYVLYFAFTFRVLRIATNVLNIGRGTCYGISAALGKTGAAIGTQAFTPIQIHLGKK